MLSYFFTVPYYDNDHPWKLIFTYFFQEAILFTEKALHDLIDWDRGVEFLEQELHEAIKTRFKSAKLCDKLAKVYLRSGEELILLVHIEIEANPKADFPLRFVWHRLLIFDRHKTEKVCSMAIFTGRKSKHQVDSYTFKLLNNELTFQFPVLKVWELDEAKLMASDNFFAIFLLAQKYANDTKKNMGQRFVFRKPLLELGLQKKNIPKLKILQGLIFVDYLTALPQELVRDFVHYRAERMWQRSPDMWITRDYVKEFDNIVERTQGGRSKNSCGRQRRHCAKPTPKRKRPNRQGPK